MTATELMHTYRYHGGEWETRGPQSARYEWELWSGVHHDAVPMRGFEDGGNREVRIVVKPSREGISLPDRPMEDRTTRFSAAYKWGYARAVLYGDPPTPHDPHVTVLEIAEDAFEEARPVSPHPYLVYANLGLTTHTIFVDGGFPSLTRLLGEILPLLGGSPKPQAVSLYDLHKWETTGRR